MLTVDVVSENMSRPNFQLNPLLWSIFINDSKDIKGLLENLKNWHEIKYFNESGDINPEINRLPNDKGGIYFFIVKTDILPQEHQYLMYIGRVQNTESQNLRKRCKEYFNEYQHLKRLHVHRMLVKFRDYVYLRYLPLTDNEEIIKIENALIKTILPPCNPKVPDRIIQMASQDAW